MEKLSRDQLCAELAKCHQERDRLRNLLNDNPSANDKQANNNPNETIGSHLNETNLIEQLRQERDQARDELMSLEREMDELHDNFKEEENDQFEQVKQELDSAVKNCKIMQIKLNKSERQYAQLEQVKLLLERQLEDQLQQQSIGSVSSTNHQHVSMIQKKQQQCDKINFIQTGSNVVKLASSQYDQLMRDLNDTIERERDLAEQVKDAQEEARAKSERLQLLETENETLLENFNKLSKLNVELESSIRRQLNQNNINSKNIQTEADILQQNTRLKLDFDLCQAENRQIKEQNNHLTSELAKQAQEFDSKCKRLESELASYTSRSILKRSGAVDSEALSSSSLSEQQVINNGIQQSQLELEYECRQLRNKLIQSNREIKQLKQQLSFIASDQNMNKKDIKDIQELAKLRQENTALIEVKLELEHLLRNDKGAQDQEKSDQLLTGMRKQLENTEKELARAKGRLVELDIELSRTSRQHRQLLESLETRGQVALSSAPNSASQSMMDERRLDTLSRLELRQLLRDRDRQIIELKGLLRASGTVKMIMSTYNSNQSSIGSQEVQNDSDEKQIDVQGDNNVDSARIECLDKEKSKAENKVSILERERTKMQEELDRMRQLNDELRFELDKARKQEQESELRLNDMKIVIERLRSDLLSRKQHLESERHNQNQNQNQNQIQKQNQKHQLQQVSLDPQILAKDLNEMKIKNQFLLRELELSRQECANQLEDKRREFENQLKRAIELAQLEVRETELANSGKLRDEIAELKVKLTQSQRSVARANEDIGAERDKLRQAERDWRRDKSQLQQKFEQLESQLALERRAAVFKVKEYESTLREKDREQLTYQDKCLQLERDLKRMQSKYSIYEESCETKLAKMSNELDEKKTEIQELIRDARAKDEQHFESIKRLQNEKATLTEALESIKCTLDEKFAELKSVRDLIVLRQDQIYRERQQNQEKLDDLTRKLLRATEHESQCKMLRHQLQVQDKQLETNKRELCTIKDEKQRLKARCDDLERRCHLFEKQELQAKTSALGKSLGPMTLRSNQVKQSNAFSNLSKEISPIDTNANSDQSSDMTEKLVSKLNDQRKLISMLKQQVVDSQLELKKVKLLHSCEFSKWQCRINELTSRLNETEERLLFEMSLVSPASLKSNTNRIEIKWTEERKASNDLIAQQQVENDKLSRDLKRLSQAHDLLRMHCKQIESHNEKLSQKIIEYQQRDLQSDPKLEHLSRQVNDLEARNSKLMQHISRLKVLMNDQVKPLIDTVGKIMQSLESNQGKQSNNSSCPLSTLRPLITDRPNIREQSSIDDTDNRNDDDLIISSAQPAHQMNAAKQSRKKTTTTTLTSTKFTQFLSSSKRNTDQEDEDSNSIFNKEHQEQFNGNKDKVKTTRKVRLKSSSIGLSIAEKRQLKSRLELIAKQLNELDDMVSIKSEPQVDIPTRPTTPVINQRDTPYRRAFYDSDLESSSDIYNNQPLHRKQELKSVNGNPKVNNIKRHSYDPVGSNLSSLVATNRRIYAGYDSETSLVSDDKSSLPASYAGAESDSCLGTSSYLHHSTGADSAASNQSSGKKMKKKRGLTGRLTNTIRSLSRSLVGLTSDSEADSEMKSSNKTNKFIRSSSQENDDDQIHHIRV